MEFYRKSNYFDKIGSVLEALVFLSDRQKSIEPEISDI